MEKREGFTLIELLVVLVIIAILVGGGWYYYGTKINNARATKVADETSKIRSALTIFEQQTGYMPKDINELWKDSDASGNKIPGWSGPYIMPPGGDMTVTTLKSGTGATITVSCDSKNGEQIVFTNVPVKVAQEYDNEFDDGSLSSGLVTYDSTNHVLKTTVRKQAFCI